jgi:hypothetical protein
MTRNRDTSRGAPRDSQGLRHVMGLAAGWVLLLVPLAGYAQSFDGTYVGMLSCPALPNGRPLSVEFSMTVSGSRASYERTIVRPARSGQSGGADPTGSYERGSGTVTPTGELVLVGKCDGSFSCDAEYRGELGANPIRLTGAQRWHYRDRPDAERPCQIDLRRPG